MQLKGLKKLILCTGAMLFVCAAVAQDRKISLKADRQPLKDVISQIELASKYSIVYSDDVLTDTLLVSVNAINKPVAEVLQQILGDKGLFFSLISENLIAIGGKANNSRDKKNSSEQQVTGKITDRSGEPVPYATVVLFKQQEHIGGGISDEQGVFRFSIPVEPSAKYRLTVAVMGYQPFEGLVDPSNLVRPQQLVLTTDVKTLGTVNVTASRPMVERLADRFIVNVENSALSTGFTGLEVLQRSPGLWVTADGAIKLKGNQSVMVMINDVVQRMSESDLAEYLRSMRSEDIAKIEIISSPPSEFEASGSAGKICVFAVRLDTFEKIPSQVFYVGTNTQQDLTAIRRFLLK
ncbi:MAG: hypothetical protein EOO89_11095, partial [Pedobacter sp.]